MSRSPEKRSSNGTGTQNQSRKLRKQDIEDTLGVKEYEKVENLELLFTNFTELNCLDGFPALRRLSCIDNGIKRISNLEPVSLSLQILNLSDQDISKLENLQLPNLRELYLHRNYIRSVGSSSLSGCPKLKKLWLCQNQISTIDGLHAVPELQELWLQSNQIASLEGLSCCRALNNLALAGNNVSDFGELRRLSSLTTLSHLSFQDIHFGRCPVTDEDGYKEFVVCHLPRVKYLDGVEIEGEHVDDAHALYTKEVEMFNGMMNEIEDSHTKYLQSIAHKQQSRTSHSTILEKEMVSALSELEGFVAEGRNNISRQVKRQNDILHSNIKDLKQNIDIIYKNTKKSIETSARRVKSDYDLMESLFLTFEKVNEVIAQVSDLLSMPKSGESVYVHHPISDNTPDFQHFASVLANSAGHDEVFLARGVKPLGLMKLFKTHLRSGRDNEDSTSNIKLKSPVKSPVKSFLQVGSSKRRAFTVCNLSLLRYIMKNDWSKIEETLVFCSNPGVAVSLFFSDPSVQLESGMDVSSYEVSQSGKRGSTSDDEMPLLLAESDMPAYASAKNILPFVLICCDIDIVSTGIDTYVQEAAESKDPQLIRLPVNPRGRADLLRELKQSRKRVGLQLEHGMGWMYTLPQSRRQGGRVNSADSKRGISVDNADVAELVYISVCTDTVIDGGLRLLEQRLEVLLSPLVGNGLESMMYYDEPRVEGSEGPSDEARGREMSSSRLLSAYEDKIKLQVQRYVDQVLEELSSDQADVLRDVNSKVYKKEDQLRKLKEELVQERKMQENLLRDMRVYGEQNNNDSKGRGKVRGSKFN